MYTDIRYRPNVGVVVFNKQGKVLSCRHRQGKYSTLYWQMPQGGVERSETPLQAAYREIKEETNIEASSLKFLKQSSRTYKYDYLKKKGDYIGQEQMWMAFKFVGNDNEIDVLNCPDAIFFEWQWEDLGKTPDLTIPFKKGSYEFMVSEFKNLF